MKINIKEMKQGLKDKNSTVGNKLVQVPKDEWPHQLIDSKGLQRVWRSREFLVQEHLENGYIRLSIIDVREIKAFGKQEYRYGSDITWDDLQKIKAKVGYGDRCAVEIFPPDQLLVNIQNIRHLWILDEVPPYCWGAQKL
jgi:hypothetical protein